VLDVLDMTKLLLPRTPKVIGMLCFRPRRYVGRYTTSWRQFKPDCHKLRQLYPWPHGRGD